MGTRSRWFTCTVNTGIPHAIQQMGLAWSFIDRKCLEKDVQMHCSSGSCCSTVARTAAQSKIATSLGVQVLTLGANIYKYYLHRTIEA